jgi:decaprenyl-phosphate phosphoribosyltransferase
VRSTAYELLLATRPWQWIKNGVVLLPWIFGRRFSDPQATLDAWLAVLAFCALSAATYLWNDVRDRASDAANPLRRERPIAAGRLSARAASRYAGVLAVLGLVLLVATNPTLGQLDTSAVPLGGAYLLLTTIYTYFVPRAGLVGAVIVAWGFVLRVLAGGAAAEIEVSNWLVLCTFLGALTAALGKRAADAGQGSGAAWVAGATFVGAYVAYAVSGRTTSEFGTPLLVLGAPWLLFGVARFLTLARGSALASDPARAFGRDPGLVLCILGYAATVAWVLCAIAS